MHELDAVVAGERPLAVELRVEDEHGLNYRFLLAS
jgi:hypothetical protein